MKKGIIMKKVFNKIASKIYYLTLPIIESGGYTLITRQKLKEYEKWVQEAQENDLKEDHSPEWEN